MAETKQSHVLLEEYFGELTFDDILNLNKDSDPILVQKIIKSFDTMMAHYASKITYTQLRNILQLVKKEEYETSLSTFYMMLPKLAYIEGRPQKDEKGKQLISFIRAMATAVANDQYKGFKEAMNTIVAFHKLYG
jgi:CRISPR/Cas system CSM-associated protein Csm2 small subunit